MTRESLNLLEFHKLSAKRGVFYFDPLPAPPELVRDIVHRMDVMPATGEALVGHDPLTQLPILEPLNTSEHVITYVFDDQERWRGFEGPKDIWEICLLAQERKEEAEAFLKAWDHAEVVHAS